MNSTRSKSGYNLISQNKLHFLLVLILLAGCRKYENDEKIVINSPKARLAKPWLLTHVYINGVDSVLLRRCERSIEFVKINKLKHMAVMSTTAANWDLVNLNKEINFNVIKDIDSTIWPYFDSKNMRWKILKLTDKEMQVKFELRNNEVNLFFEADEI